MGGLTYREQRAIDDFLRGRGALGSQFWLRLDAPAEIDEKHRTAVEAAVGMETASGGITPIHADTLCMYASGLGELETVLLEESFTPRKTWFLVEVARHGATGRKFKVLDRRDPQLTLKDALASPPTPVAGPINPPPPAQPAPAPEAKPPCASCGKPAAGLSFCPHCGVKQ